MRQPRIYLCGPIFGCSDDEAHDWRAEMRSLVHGAVWIDPMERDYRGREDECYRDIVVDDKDDIACSDMVVANCWRPSWGTAMELHWAHHLGKPTYAVVPNSQRISPWLRYHARDVFATLEEAADHLRKVIAYR